MSNIDESEHVQAGWRALTPERYQQLKRQSMLHQAARIHDDMRSGRGKGQDDKTFMQRPYAKPNVQQVVRDAPVWFTAYMASTMGLPEPQPGQETKPLRTLADPRLWDLFEELGIRGIHTGPVMTAGGFRDAADDISRYNTIDGWFDPIALEIDRSLGENQPLESLRSLANFSTESQAAGNEGSSLPVFTEGLVTPLAEQSDGLSGDHGRLVRAARNKHAKIIGDIVPGHTGMGADFHLALRAFEHYPGLYLLVRIDDKIDRLPEPIRTHLNDIVVSDANQLSRLLTEDEVSALRDARLIPGSPQRPMGVDAGHGWSITRPITGLSTNVNDDGSETVTSQTRRWVYLHFFNPQQPTLNWFDPSFAAWRLVIGELNYVIWELKADGVRLDANSFLGLEIKPEPTNEPLANIQSPVMPSQTWSEAHPLSEMATNMLAWQARRLGGFSFQEMNMDLEELAKFSELGPDLAYDFITRPACEHALLTGNADFLHLMYNEMEKHKINPLSLVHALQNHDDLTYELVHFLRSKDGETFMLGDEDLPGFTADDQKRESHDWGLDEKQRQAALAEPPTSSPAKSFAQHRPTSVWGRIRQEIREKSFVTETGGHLPFNRKSDNGICTTLPGLIAAGCGCKSLDELALQDDRDAEPEEKLDIERHNARPKEIRDAIKRGHLLLAAFNALQPGVFAVSGWDLVGALPLRREDVPTLLLSSGIPYDEKANRPLDFRWINRGAYRLLSTHTANSMNILPGTESVRGLPEAENLYGPLDRQTQDPASFYVQLRSLLKIRTNLKVHLGQFGGTLELGNPSVFGMLTWVREEGRPSTAVVAVFNFHRTAKATVTLKPHVIEGWSRHWKRRWTDGNSMPIDDKQAERERTRLRRWRVFDAGSIDYDPTASIPEPESLETPITLGPWAYKVLHLRP